MPYIIFVSLKRNVIIIQEYFSQDKISEYYNTFTLGYAKRLIKIFIICYIFFTDTHWFCFKLFIIPIGYPKIKIFQSVFIT